MTTTLLPLNQEVDQALVDLFGPDLLDPDNQITVNLNKDFEDYVFRLRDRRFYFAQDYGYSDRLIGRLNSVSGYLTDKMFVDQQSDWDQALESYERDVWAPTLIDLKGRAESTESVMTCLNAENIHLLGLFNGKSHKWRDNGQVEAILVAKRLTPDLYWLFVSGCPDDVVDITPGSIYLFNGLKKFHFEIGALFYAFMERLIFSHNSAPSPRKVDRLRDCNLIMSTGLNRTLCEFLDSHSLSVQTRISPNLTGLNTLTAQPFSL